MVDAKPDIAGDDQGIARAKNAAEGFAVVYRPQEMAPGRAVCHGSEMRFLRTAADDENLDRHAALPTQFLHRRDQSIHSFGDSEASNEEENDRLGAQT